MPRHILIIAFHYPPVRGSSGIQRTLKFSTYLREHGWEPIVLTVTPRAFEQVSDDQMGEIPPGMRVERAFALNTAKHLAIGGRYLNWMAQPDRWVSWWPAAVWRGLQIIRRHQPEAILSTYPIATAHLIGLTLQRLSGLPWIADCRDSISEPGYPADPLTWRTNRRLEAAMVKHCARAVFTTEGTRQMYAERYPQAPSARWAVIENGYDEENFRDAERDFAPQRLGPPGRLTLLHSGVLYPQERDPRPFFAALRTLRAAGEIGADNLRVLLRATASDELYRPMLAEYGIVPGQHVQPSDPRQAVRILSRRPAGADPDRPDRQYRGGDGYGGRQPHRRHPRRTRHCQRLANLCQRVAPGHAGRCAARGGRAALAARPFERACNTAAANDRCALERCPAHCPSLPRTKPSSVPTVSKTEPSTSSSSTEKPSLSSKAVRIATTPIESISGKAPSSRVSSLNDAARPSRWRVSSRSESS
jgi:glycosyltransferase involved in cell wall biosynthesis